MNATFTAFNAHTKTDTLSSNYELWLGISGAAGKEKLYSTKRKAPFVLFLASLTRVFGPLPLFPLSFLWRCTTPSQPLLPKTNCLPKKWCRVIDTCRNWVTFGPVSVCDSSRSGKEHPRSLLWLEQVCGDVYCLCLRRSSAAATGKLISHY